MQRLRWAQGGMKILRSRDNPLIKKGLSFKQRMSHFAAIFTYFDAYQKLIYLLTPVILLFTGIMPIKVISGIDFMLHWIPYFGLTMLANVVLGRGFFDYFEVEKFNTLKMVTFIRASFSLIFKKNMKFNVTPKSIDQTVKQKDRRELSFHIIILSLIIASVLFALVNSLIRQVVFYPSFAALAIAIFWSAFNGIVLFLALHEVLKRVYLRKDYRFRQYMTGIIETENGKRIDCVINNISRGGLSLVVDRDDAPEGFEGQVLKVMTTLNGESLVLPGNAVYIRPNEDNTWGIGFRFAEISEEMKKKYYNYLFVTAPRFTYETSKCERRRRRASRI